jgi:RHS repeat-associated protein
MRRLLLVLACIGLLPTSARAQEVVEYYGVDAIGSVRVVFDSAGALVGRHDYGPFGEQLAPSPIGAKVYAQLFRDGEAGQDYAQARMYAPRTGRLSAPDPVFAGLANPQRLNRYAYVHNNPLSFTDSTGLAEDCEFNGRVNCKVVVRPPGRDTRPGGGGGSGDGDDPGCTPYPTAMGAMSECGGEEPPEGGPQTPGTPPDSGTRTPPPIVVVPPVTEIIAQKIDRFLRKVADPCTWIPHVSVSGGPSVTAGGLPFVYGPFVGGGASGSFDLANGQFAVSAQAQVSVGMGMYAGAGTQGGVGVAASASAPGLSVQKYKVIEGNVGWGPSAGAAVNVSDSGGSVGKGIVSKYSFGYGGMVAAGVGQSVNYAFPALYCN